MIIESIMLILAGSATLQVPKSEAPQRVHTTLSLAEVTQPSLALSPDGETLYFQILGDLVAVPARGGQARQLTSGPAYDSWPTPTADGAWLYFMSDRGGSATDVYRLSLTGEEIEQVTDLGLDLGQLSVAPDGTSFAAVAGAGRGGALVFRALPGGERDVLDDVHPSLRRPTLLADNRIVLLNRTRRGSTLLVGDESGHSTLYEPEGARGIEWATVDPGGLFACLRESGDWSQRQPSFEELLVVRLQDGEVVYRARVSSYRESIPSEARAALSEDAVFFPQDGAIVRVDLASGEATTLEWTVELEREVPGRKDDPGASRRRREADARVFGVATPRPAPDGQAVVFAAGGDLFLARRAQPSLRLTAGPEQDSNPWFSESGAQVLFARDGVLHSLTLEARVVETLGAAVDAHGLEYFAPSSDGASVLVMGSVRKPRVLELDRSGETQTELAPATGRWVTLPSYAAAGEVLFVADNDGAVEVLAIGPEREATTAAARLARPPFMVTGSLDGRWLACLRDGRAWVAQRSEAPVSESDLRAVGPPGAHSIAFSANASELWVGAGNTVTPVDCVSGRAAKPWVLNPTFEAPPSYAPLLIRDATIVDLATGELRPGQRIAIEDGRITRIEAEREAPEPRADATVMDGAGRFVIPALFDMHVHDLGGAGPTLLAYGITTVRQLGSVWPHQRATQEAIRSGARVGPDFLSVGEIFEGGAPWWGNASFNIESVAEGRALLEARVRDGIDGAKFYHTLPRAIRAPLVADSIKLGLPTTAHVASLRDVVTALDDGVGCLEHFPEYVPVLAADLLECMRAYACAWCPTLTVRGVSDWKRHSSATELDSEFFLSTVPPEHLRAWSERDKVGPMSATSLEQLVLERAENVVRAMDMGVPVVVGSDCSRGNALIGPSTHWEIEALVRGGASPADALNAATRSAAALAGMPDRGVVREGARADLLLLEGNPLEEIANTRRIAHVIRGGRPYRPKELIDD